LAIGVLSAALLLASAQATRGQGSTGGTLGKIDQSLSGNQQKAKPAPAPPQPHGGQRFTRPTLNGLRVDYCLGAFSQGCGDPAANEWCRRKGLSSAASYKIEKAPNAYRLGDGSRDNCPGPLGGCDVFSEVVCR
jgi:hypothetical protein